MTKHGSVEHIAPGLEPAFLDEHDERVVFEVSSNEIEHAVVVLGATYRVAIFDARPAR